MKFLLKTTYPCLVKTSSAECELDQNDILEIEDEKSIVIYPQNTKIVPFYINLSVPKDCERYSFCSRDEKKYIILENLPIYEIKRKEKLNFSGKIVEICVEKEKISFETSETKIECRIENASQNYDCFKIKNFACVQFENELFVFSVKEGKVFHFVGEIEIDGNQVCVTKKFFDSEMREKKSIFRLEEEIELENEEFVCTQTCGRVTEKIKSLAPFKLLECVKAKDYVRGLNFLSEKLQKQIDSTQIKEFFGNFTDFLPISTTEFITISDKNKKFVQFSMNGNFVDDISVDDLN